MFLGIDTSCYTTSVAVVGQDGLIIKDSRKFLEVNLGERGLQQSKAVWQHLNNLPIMIEDLFAQIDVNNLKSVTVSAKPRPANNSYLPVFNVGVSHAKTIASALQIPLNLTTHQEGHLMAGCCPELLAKQNFLVLHLSGGTSELLQVAVRNNPFGFAEVILGKSLDLHAGQFVDRVGVALGLAFPSGPALEELAQKVTNIEKQIPSSVTKGLDFSFSGPESCAQRLIAAGVDQREIARAVEQAIVNTFRKVIARAASQTGLRDVLIVGGVSANQYIRTNLKLKLRPQQINLFFANPSLSSDNGVGAALMGSRYFNIANISLG